MRALPGHGAGRCPTGSTSRTIAACTAATTAAGSWESIEDGLPSTFGFPAAAHPRDPDTLYLLPLNGDSTGRYVPDASAAVWRTRDAGASWQDLREGLPQQDAYFGVLRQAHGDRPLEPAGVYFGTNTGSLFASADEGDSWSLRRPAPADDPVGGDPGRRG